VVKSPTSVAEEPVLVLAPLVLRRTSRRSGQLDPLAVRVQKAILLF